MTNAKVVYVRPTDDGLWQAALGGWFGPWPESWSDAAPTKRQAAERVVNWANTDALSEGIEWLFEREMYARRIVTNDLRFQDSDVLTRVYVEEDILDNESRFRACLGTAGIVSEDWCRWARTATQAVEAVVPWHRTEDVGPDLPFAMCRWIDDSGFTNTYYVRILTDY